MNVICIIAGVYMLWMLCLFSIVLRLCWIYKTYQAIDCEIMSVSSNPCLQDFSEEHPTPPEKQSLVYSYDYNGEQKMGCSRLKYKDALKYISTTSRLFIHKTNPKKCYFSMDLLVLDSYLPKCIMNSIIVYFIFSIIWSILLLNYMI